MTQYQRLVPRSLAPDQNPGKPGGVCFQEGVRATVKDPLWFPSRQWQMGEFHAGNCGAIADVRLSSFEKTIDQVGNNTMHTINDPVREPLEPYVEAANPTTLAAETIDIRLDKSNCWKDQNLEYGFIHCTSDGNVSLRVQEYFGEHLDWYSFMIQQADLTGAGKVVSWRQTHGQLWSSSGRSSAARSGSKGKPSRSRVQSRSTTFKAGRPAADWRRSCHRRAKSF